VSQPNLNRRLYRRLWLARMDLEEAKSVAGELLARKTGCLALTAACRRRQERRG